MTDRVARAVVRGGLALLGLVNAIWGVAAALWPRAFYDGFPGLGQRWTAAYPPYNRHLVTDLGATFLMMAALLLVAAWLADRRVTAVVLAGVLVFNTIHLVFHATHHGELAGFGLAASLTSLVLGVLAPVGLLALDRARPHS